MMEQQLILVRNQEDQKALAELLSEGWHIVGTPHVSMERQVGGESYLIPVVIERDLVANNGFWNDQRRMKEENDRLREFRESVHDYITQWIQSVGNLNEQAEHFKELQNAFARSAPPGRWT